MEDLIQKLSYTIDGKHNYGSAIRALNNLIKTESDNGNRQEEIYDKLFNFYETGKKLWIYQAVHFTGKPCLDMTVNLLAVYHLNGIKSRQFIPEDLQLYHTSLALVDNWGKVIRHLESTHAKGFEKNLYAGKSSKGALLTAEETLDTILCQKAIDMKDDVAALDVMTKIEGRTSNIANVYHTKARLLYDIGAFREAREELKRILRKNPRNPEANLSMANVYGSLGKSPSSYLKKAEQQANLLLKEYPQFKDEFQQILEKIKIKTASTNLVKKLNKVSSFF